MPEFADPIRAARAAKEAFARDSSSRRNAVASGLRPIHLLCAPGAGSLVHDWLVASGINGFAPRVLEIPPRGGLDTSRFGVELMVVLGEFPMGNAVSLKALRDHFSEALVVRQSCSQEDLQGLPAGCVALGSDVDPDKFLRWFRRHSYESRFRTTTSAPSGTLDLTLRKLSVGDYSFCLQPRETDLLRILSSFEGRPCPTGRLCSEVLGANGPAQRRMLWQLIYQLRQKLGVVGGVVDTSRGKGYRCLLRLSITEVEVSK